MKYHRKVKKLLTLIGRLNWRKVFLLHLSVILHHILLKNGTPSWLFLMDLLGLNNINLLPRHVVYFIISDPWKTMSSTILPLGCCQNDFSENYSVTSQGTNDDLLLSSSHASMQK